MYMILYVAADLQQARDMLNVWVKAGVSGITILESAGMRQFLDKGVLRDDLGPMPSMRRLFQSQETHHRTIFSVVEDDEMLQRVIQASENFVEDWSKPDVGVLFAWPILCAFGLGKNFDQGER